MLFNTFYFFVFFLVFFICWLLFPAKFKWVSLLIGSVYFYCVASSILILVPIIICLITYICSLQINRLKANDIIFGSIIFIIVGFLLYYKYLNSFIDFAGLSALSRFSVVAVPIGISYFTFQAIGYLIDAKNNHIAVERNIFKLFLYLIFFTKIIAGPVERAGNFLSQVNQPAKFLYSNFSIGIKLILVGLFKKVVLGDRLNLLISPAFNDLASNEGMPIILASFIFPLQLYMDFSGYTDMARGFSKILGINLTENFNKPFSSTTLTEFWRRWHISLSSWFNEYVFKSLTISTRNWNQFGLFVSLVITFTIIGVWHGPTMGYLVYGVLIGLIVFLETFSKKGRKKIAKKMSDRTVKIIGHAYFYLIIVFLFLFIKTETLPHYANVVKSIVKIELVKDTKDTFNHFVHRHPFSTDKLNTYTYVGNLLNNYNTRVILIASLFLMILNSIKSNEFNLLNRFKKITLVRHSGYIFLLLLIMQFGLFHNTNEFLYFKF